MRKRDFIGKLIDVTQIGMLAFASYYEKTYDHPVIEIDLDDFDREASAHKTGFNSYSVRVELNNNRISTIKRIGHHDRNGESKDVEVPRFPFQGLEGQAQDRLRILVTELSSSLPD